MFHPTALLLLAAAAAAQPLPGPAVPFEWTACPEVGAMEVINPAGFAFIEGLRLRVGASMSDSAFEGLDGASLAMPGGGLSGWWEDACSMRRFGTSGAVGLFGGTAALGLTYEWLDPTVASSEWKDSDRWTAGLLVRPSDWLSLGLVRLGEVDPAPGDDLDPLYRAGAAFRPFGDLLTLTVDLETGPDLEEAAIRGGAELRPVSGLALRLAAGEDRYRFGLEAGLGRVAVCAAALGTESMDHAGSRAELVLSSMPGENLLAPSGYFVRLTPGETDELPTRPFLGSVQPCFTDQILLLRSMASDPSVAGVIVDISDGAFNAAQAEELRGALEELRLAGKRVYAWLRSGGNGACYLASCADGVWMHPSGHLSFNGLGMETFFLREMLDDLGIYPDLLHIGAYKSASDMLTRTDISEAQREASTALLQSMQEVLVEAVGESRGLDPAGMEAVLGSGGYTAGRAVVAGLVDGVAYADEVEDRIGEEIGGDVVSVPLATYRSNRPCPVSWGPGEHVAVVVASGTITGGVSGSSFPLGRIMGSETVCDAIEAAASAPGTRALVVRIDSGGGDALASDDLYHAVSQAAERMPVAVSMGAVAASGGYFMACGADRIFADRLTITGSIGIISGKIAFGGLLDSLGVNVEAVTGGPMADMYSVFRPFTDEERERVGDLMRDGYETFVGRVAEGRGMTFEEVDAVGQGRVWSGADALELGLIDAWGGVADAVEWAAREAGMDADRMPETVVYPTPPFPGTPSLPGVGITTGLDALLGGELYLYMAPPLIVD